jgi:hypothetical protein
MGFSDLMTSIFQTPLKALFGPYNYIMNQLPPLCWKLSAVSIFVFAMIWVCRLNPEYVNLDAPSKKWYHDLRVWTVFSMLPHVCIYLYF